MLKFLFLAENAVQLKKNLWDFPGGPVVNTPRSQCRGPGFDPPGN